MSENDNNTVAELSMQCRLRAIPKQFLVLLKFMERHGDLSRTQGHGPKQRLETDLRWDELVKLLDGIDGGVKKSKDKWKKVWADWKAKTKKKALTLRRYPNGPRRYSASITNLEQRLLTVMGLAHAVTNTREDKGESENQPCENESPFLEEQSTIYIQTDSQSLDVEEIMFELTPPYVAHSIEEAPEYTPVPPPHDATHKTERISQNADQRPQSASPRPTSSIAGTSKAAGKKRRRLASPTANSSGPRRHALHRALKQVKTAFERRTNEFASVEHRRLRLEEIRERNEHQRKTEKLRLESRRIDMEEQRNAIFASIANSLADILSQPS